MSPELRWFEVAIAGGFAALMAGCAERLIAGGYDSASLALLGVGVFALFVGWLRARRLDQ